MSSCSLVPRSGKMYDSAKSRRTLTGFLKRLEIQSIKFYDLEFSRVAATAKPHYGNAY